MGYRNWDGDRSRVMGMGGRDAGRRERREIGEGNKGKDDATREVKGRMLVHYDGERDDGGRMDGGSQCDGELLSYDRDGSEGGVMGMPGMVSSYPNVAATPPAP